MLIKTKSLLVFTLVTSLVTGCGNDGQDGTNPDDVPQSQDSDATGTDDGTETSKPDSGDQGDQGSDDSSDTDDGNGEQDETDGQETPENQEEQQEDPQQEDPQEEPESISCEHDICVVDYPDIAEGKAESLGNTYYSCVEGVLGEVKTCPENQICMDGGCVDAFTEGDEKSCLISPDDALSLMHENDYGRCSANGNYSIVCRYGKLTVRSCERPCENAEYGYVRCPQTQEDEALVYYDRYTNSRFSLHYAQLSDEEKTIYRALFSAVLNHEEEYSIQSISKDSCQKVLDAFKADASDLAGQKLSLSAKSSEEDPATLENCQYKLKYTEKTEDQINQDKALQKAAFEILETMDVYSSDVEKEMAVHNWMLTNIKKDSNSKTVYGAIVEHAANNKGLSDAFRYLMVRLMIPTFGVAGGSKSTPWNIIQIDGNYYNIDVALDRLSKCDALGYEGESCPKYTYFNRSDEFFNQHDGARKAEYLPDQGYPACTSDSLSFEALLGMDSIVSLLNGIYSIIGGHVVTNIDEYYSDMKTELESAELSDYYQSITASSLVVGADLIKQIKSLTEEERNEHYFKSLTEGKYAGYQCKIVTTTSNFDIGDGVSVAFINTIHFISAKP